MRLFAKRILTLSLIPFIFILVMECTISLYSNDIFSEQKLTTGLSINDRSYHWIKHVVPRSKILLLGSSSAKFGLSCSKLKALSNDSVSYINLGESARDPVETYLLLKRIDISGVKAAYFGLDPWIYTKYYYRYRNPFMYLDINFVGALRYSLYHDKYILIKRYRALIFHYLFPSKSDSPEIDEQPSDYGSEHLTGLPKNFNMPIEEYFQVNNFGWSELQFRYLNKIRAFCKSKNIEFNVFIPPKRSDYTKEYKSKSYLHQGFVSHLKAIQFDAPVFGTFDELDSLGNDDLFVEAYHLSTKGQTLYSEEFFNQMNRKKEKFSADYSWFSK